MSQLAYDAMVESMTRQGVPREKAVARARELYPHVATQLDAEVERKAHVLEKAEQRAVWKMAKAVGFDVYSLSQARAAKQTPGLPDLWMYRHARSPLAFWWETKRQIGGERSDAQIKFGQQCEHAGIPYGHGDRYDFAAFLEKHGITPPEIPTD